jgi:hypothetical protein
VNGAITPAPTRATPEPAPRVTLQPHDPVWNNLERGDAPAGVDPAAWATAGQCRAEDAPGPCWWVGTGGPWFAVDGQRFYPGGAAYRQETPSDATRPDDEETCAEPGDVIDLC